MAVSDKYKFKTKDLDICQNAYDHIYDVNKRLKRTRESKEPLSDGNYQTLIGSLELALKRLEAIYRKIGQNVEYDE